jgi:hypothetical protein
VWIGVQWRREETCKIESNREGGRYLGLQERILLRWHGMRMSSVVWSVRWLGVGVYRVGYSCKPYMQWPFKDA